MRFDYLHGMLIVLLVFSVVMLYVVNNNADWYREETYNCWEQDKGFGLPERCDSICKPMTGNLYMDCFDLCLTKGKVDYREVLKNE